jgi:hypothetical protein
VWLSAFVVGETWTALVLDGDTDGMKMSLENWKRTETLGLSSLKSERGKTSVQIVVWQRRADE